MIGDGAVTHSPLRLPQFDNFNDGGALLGGTNGPRADGLFQFNYSG
jgi:hypothetical protein